MIFSPIVIVATDTLDEQTGYLVLAYSNISNFIVTIEDHEEISLQGSGMINVTCSGILNVYPGFTDKPIFTLNFSSHCGDIVEIHEHGLGTGVSSLIIVLNKYGNLPVHPPNITITSTECSLSPIESIGLTLNISLPREPSSLSIDTYLLINDKEYQIPSTFLVSRISGGSIILNFPCNLPVNYALTHDRSLAVVIQVANLHYIVLLDVGEIMRTKSTTSSTESNASQPEEHAIPAPNGSENTGLTNSDAETSQRVLDVEGRNISGTIKEYTIIVSALLVVVAVILRLISTRMKNTY